MTYTTHADLGGRAARDPISPELEGEPFHAGWEARVLALTLATGATGAWNLDMSRAVRESLPGYAKLGYYEIWLEALERLLLEHGLATPAELRSGRMRVAPLRVARVLGAADVASALVRGTPTERPATLPARFTVGARVRARSEIPNHATRLPAYVRGAVGTVERVHGVHVFADAHALGLGEQPQWLYNVAFDAAALWPDAPATARVSIDAWEPYLEPA